MNLLRKQLTTKAPVPWPLRWLDSNKLFGSLKRSLNSSPFGGQYSNKDGAKNNHSIRLKELHLRLQTRMATSQRRSQCNDEYTRAVTDLNSLQSNNQVLALAKYKKPETILPLFRKQLLLSGIELDQLNRLNVIHVSGTKGKGSTCAFLEHILTKSDQTKLKIGSYNSPHLVDVTERIRINAKPIDKILFSKYFRHVYDKLKKETLRMDISMPSYFSFLTILAFHIFLEEQIDCAIIEVGMGGEYDPTNVVEKPVACAITTLDLDHTNILGKTIKQIAWTKAGIMKSHVPLFTLNHEQEEANKIIESRASEKQCPIFICKPIEDKNCRLNLGIKGPAQYINASIACQLAAYFLSKIDHNKLPDGQLNSHSVGRHPIELESNLCELPVFFGTALESCQLPGRCQIIKFPGVTYFLDGAHTRKSMDNCLEWFTKSSKNLAQDAAKFLMVNVIGERDKSEVLRPLSRFEEFQHVIFSTNRVQDTSADVLTSATFVKIQDRNYEKGLDNARNNARVWMDLVRQYSDNNPDRVFKTSTSIHASVMDSFKLIEDNKASMGSIDGVSQKPIHVLATGSLHFVGALLEALEICYPDSMGNKLV